MTSSATQPQQSPSWLSLPITPIAIVLSCLFSVIVILQNPLLNDDAYKYLRAVDLFNTNGAQAVLETYSWFNYSIVIALLDRVLPGDALLAAHLFNAALYALLTGVFIQLVRELRDTRRVQFFAALCILLFPLTNEMRYFLMRDAGFWAFTLLSVICLIRYRNSGKIRSALWWCLTLCAAALFRLEALLLLVVTPFTLLLPSARFSASQGRRHLVLLLGILVAVLICILLTAYAAGFDLIRLIAFAYRYYLPELANLLPGVANTATAVAGAMFTPDNYPGDTGSLPALAAVLFGDVLVLLLNFFNALSVPVIGFILYYRLRHAPLLLPSAASRVLLTYIGASMLALLLFILIMHFLTQRYAALLALLVLSLVPLMLDDVMTRALQLGTARRFANILGFFCVYYAIDGLHSFGYSQQHIEDGLAWARAELPATAQVKTNNFAIAYHSGLVADYDAVIRDAAAVLADSGSGDILILEVDHDAVVDVLDGNPSLEEVRRFENERGDAVRIYRYR